MKRKKETGGKQDSGADILWGPFQQLLLWEKKNEQRRGEKKNQLTLQFKETKVKVVSAAEDHTLCINTLGGKRVPKIHKKTFCLGTGKKKKFN